MVFSLNADKMEKLKMQKANQNLIFFINTIGARDLGLKVITR